MSGGTQWNVLEHGRGLFSSCLYSIARPNPRCGHVLPEMRVSLSRNTRVPMFHPKPCSRLRHLSRSTVDDITLHSARGGDRSAQARLLNVMQDHWFRFCVSQLRDSHRAEDATQETAIRVLQSLGKFDGRSSFKTWSFGIALNVCRESRRKSQRNSSVDLADGAEPAMPGDLHGDHLEYGEEAAAMHALLAELPQRQREVVTLRYFEELSVEETARAMTCAEGTVKATLFAALKTLRAKLAGPKNA